MTTESQTSQVVLGLSPFEIIRRMDSQTEYWSARDLAQQLDYTYPDLVAIIEKLRTESLNQNSAENASALYPDDHFMEVSLSEKVAGGVAHKTTDYYLSRSACFVIFQKLDPSRQNVKEGITYFGGPCQSIHSDLRALERNRFLVKANQFWKYLTTQQHVPEAPTQVQVRNRTSRRIILVGENTELVIPPFDCRRIDSETLSKLNVKTWEERHLIEVEPDTDLQSKRLLRKQRLIQITLLLGTLDVIFLTLYEVWLKPNSRAEIDLLALAFVLVNLWVVAPVVFSYLSQSLITGIRTLGQITYGLLLFIFGIVFPIGVFWFYMNSHQLLPSEIVLGGLLVVFVGTGTILPGGLYFLFARQRLENLRETFFRDMLDFDPCIETLDEAFVKYGPRVESIYGAGKTGKLGVGTPLPVFFNSFLVLLGWAFIIQTCIEDLVKHPTNTIINLNDFFNHTLMPLNYGFLGSYFFGINMLFRRYVRSDLTPKAYSHFSMRMVITTTVVWTLSTIGTDSIFYNYGASVTAFLIGFVPETGIALIIEGVKSNVGKYLWKEILTEDNPVSKLEGITIYDQARLMEEGIENVENLAHADLVELRLNTRFPMERIVDLFDQSILYIHLGNEPEFVKNRIRQLRKYGIRTATGLLKFCEDNKNENSLLEEVSKVNGDDTIPLQSIIESFTYNHWLSEVEYWRQLHPTTSKGVYKLEDFYRALNCACSKLNPAGSSYCSACGKSLTDVLKS